MAEIFISFIHEEERIAEAIQTFLKALCPSAKAFHASDRWKILAGDDWFRRIETELKEAFVIISLLSLQSVQRPWVNFEAGAAWMSKRLIPVCFGGMTKATLPKPYSHLQAIDLANMEDQYYMAMSITHELNQRGSIIATPFPVHSIAEDIDDQSNQFKQFDPYVKSMIYAHKMLTSVVREWETQRMLRQETDSNAEDGWSD